MNGGRKRKTVDWKNLLPVIIMLTKKVPKNDENEDDNTLTPKPQKQAKPIYKKDPLAITSKPQKTFSNSVNSKTSIKNKIKEKFRFKTSMNLSKNLSKKTITNRLQTEGNLNQMFREILVDQKNGPIRTIKRALALVEPGGIIM